MVKHFSGKGNVKAKKHLGQHFLNDVSIAQRIAESPGEINLDRLVEIGPGMGVLTRPLYDHWKEKLVCVEIDKESVAYLARQAWATGLNVKEADFLHTPQNEIFTEGRNGLIGNYPYNISTQIAFKVVESAYDIQFFGGMFQREVAKRFCAEHGNKEYGVTSVLLQAFYDCKYLFTVNEGSFNPPPAVKSGVMACFRKEGELGCEYKQLAIVVKTAFNQRRKTLSNALKPLISSIPGFELPEGWAGKRAEQLSVEDFIYLGKLKQSLG